MIMFYECSSSLILKRPYLLLATVYRFVLYLMNTGFALSVLFDFAFTPAYYSW